MSGGAGVCGGEGRAAEGDCRPYRTRARVEVLAGPPATGKTQALAGRACELAHEGADVLVLVARASAVAPMEARLAERLGEGSGVPGGTVRVTTPLSLALELLADPVVRASTGRRPRLVDPGQRGVLFQDLLVTGKEARRLREMLRFLERGWSELREGDPDWLVTQEELLMDGFARGLLRRMEAYHPAEAAAAAVRWLRENPAELVRARVANVLVDDGQALGRASQVLACLLAGRNLVMVWDTVDALPGEDNHPYGGALRNSLLTTTTWRCASSRRSGRAGRWQTSWRGWGEAPSSAVDRRCLRNLPSLQANLR